MNKGVYEAAIKIQDLSRGRGSRSGPRRGIGRRRLRPLPRRWRRWRRIRLDRSLRRGQRPLVILVVGHGGQGLLRPLLRRLRPLWPLLGRLRPLRPLLGRGRLRSRSSPALWGSACIVRQCESATCKTKCIFDQPITANFSTTYIFCLRDKTFSQCILCKWRDIYIKG